MSQVWVPFPITLLPQVLKDLAMCASFVKKRSRPPLWTFYVLHPPIRGLPYMTSAKFPEFFTLPPCHCHKSVDFVPFVCYLGTPLPPPTADVIYGSPLTLQYVTRCRKSHSLTVQSASWRLDKKFLWKFLWQFSTCLAAQHVHRPGELPH